MRIYRVTTVLNLHRLLILIDYTLLELKFQKFGVKLIPCVILHDNVGQVELSFSSVEHECVQDLLSNWEKRMEVKIQRFTEFAQDIQRIDRDLILQTEKLQVLLDEQATVQERQNQVQEMIQVIEKEQQQVLESLDIMDTALETLLGPDKKITSKSGETIDFVSNKLRDLEGQLKAAHDVVDSVVKASQPEPLANVAKVFAFHQDTIENIQLQTSEIEKKLDAIKQQQAV